MPTANEKIKDIEKIVQEHSNKLAKCRGEFQEKDHDKITKLEGRVDTHDTQIKENKDDQDDLYDKHVELAGSINEITDKLSLLNDTEIRRKNFFYAVLTGVLILLIGSFIIWVGKTTLDQMKHVTKEQQIDNTSIMTEILKLKRELRK